MHWGAASGKSPQRFWRSNLSQWPARTKNKARVKTHFASRFNAQERAWPRSREVSVSFLQKSWMMPPPRLVERGVSRDRHDTRGGDAVAVTALAGVIIHADERGGCGREVVWSWHSGANAKSAAMLRASCRRRGQSSRSPRRARISVKTIAQGMLDDRAEPVVTAACFFSAGGPWERPSPRHSLRPLDLFEGLSIAESGRTPPRECVVMSEDAGCEI